MLHDIFGTPQGELFYRQTKRANFNSSYFSIVLELVLGFRFLRNSGFGVLELKNEKPESESEYSAKCPRCFHSTSRETQQQKKNYGSIQKEIHGMPP